MCVCVCMYMYWFESVQVCMWPSCSYGVPLHTRCNFFLSTVTCRVPILTKEMTWSMRMNARYVVKLIVRVRASPYKVHVVFVWWLLYTAPVPPVVQVDQLLQVPATQSRQVRNDIVLNTWLACIFVDGLDVMWWSGTLNCIQWTNETSGGSGNPFALRVCYVGFIVLCRLILVVHCSGNLPFMYCGFRLMGQWLNGSAA